MSAYARESSRPVAFFCKLVIVILLLLLWIEVARAQDGPTGTIRGTVMDTAGAVIPGATVAIVNNGTGFRRSSVSDAEGGYAFDLLLPGDYSGRAEAPGMSPQETAPMHVEVGGTVELDFRLSVAGSRETLTVSGAPAEVETQPSSVSATIDERAIQDLPLNGRRFTDLALLAPGVTEDPRGLTSSSRGDLAFGGVRGYQSSFLVDGADNNNGFFAQARGRYRAPYQFSNEVVQEFRVSSNSYGAELGRAGGAVVNVVTKSGSNAIHGAGFYFMRDSALNAQHPFVDFKPSDRQQQFGFTIGGPIRRNRAFFFAGFDQHIFHVPTVVRFADGSSAVTAKAIAGSGFPGDYEPSDKDLVLGAAAKLSKLAGEYGSKLLGNAGFLKLDVSLTPKHYLSGRLSTSRYYGENNVFFDPSSPITNFAISDNGEERVTTESASLSLNSSLNFRLSSHLRAQYSRDLQDSTSNSSDPLTRIYGLIEGFGRSTILPRGTREHRLHFAETFSLEAGRQSWKLGGDALLTKVSNFFPSMFGGEYIFDTIKVNPWTFEPMHGGMEITPLRAYAHQVPRYYMQNFGSAMSHPDSNEYAWFLQDSVRITGRLAVSLGLRYDLQTFSTRELRSNPLWPDSGKVPNDRNNFAPRFGLGYSIGNERPLVIRAGYGMFYTRIPQIYTSAIITGNGLTSTHLFLDNVDQTNQPLFPVYPSTIINCATSAATCAAPPNISRFLSSDLSAFAPTFHTPKVEQASLTLEREMAHRLAAGISYMYVHGEGLIRARDVNLPLPQQLSYPVYDEAGTNFLGSYYNVDSFSSWEFTRSLTCPYPPCISPLARLVPQLGAVNEFESAGSSVYHGMTVSIRRRMTRGLYLRLGYTFAHAIDDGQDSLLTAGSTVQNSYLPKSERATSVTDQRHRLTLSWIAEPKPFDRNHELLGALLNNWKLSGLVTYGSGRPVNARIGGDPNRDGNFDNDRLPGYGRNAFVGPDYATIDMRLARVFRLGGRKQIQLMMESFNLLNRTNERVTTNDQGFVNSAGDFVPVDNRIGINYFPGSYRRSGSFLKAGDAYAPRQVQLAVRFSF